MARGRGARRRLHTDGKFCALYACITVAGIGCPPPAAAAWGGMELLLTDPDGNALLFL